GHRRSSRTPRAILARLSSHHGRAGTPGSTGRRSQAPRLGRAHLASSVSSGCHFRRAILYSPWAFEPARRRRGRLAAAPLWAIGAGLGLVGLGRTQRWRDRIAPGDISRVAFLWTRAPQPAPLVVLRLARVRSEEHTSEL